MKKVVTIAWIILTIIIILLLSFQNCSYRKENEELNFNISSQTLEIKKWRDNDNNLHASILVLESEKVKTFLELESSNKQIIRLQEEVKKVKKELKDKNSVTIITSETVYDTVFKSSDTTTCNKEDSIRTSWVFNHFGFKGDSSFTKISMKEEYSVIIGTEKKKPHRTYAQVTSFNPHVINNEIITYMVSGKTRQKRLGIGPAVGGGLLFSKSGVYLGGYVGISLNYTLIYIY